MGSADPPWKIASRKQAFANSVDPDETPHDAASHQGLRCLLKGISMTPIIGPASSGFIEYQPFPSATDTNSNTFQLTRDQARCAPTDTDEHPRCNSNKKEPKTKSLSEMQMLYYAKQNSFADKQEKFYERITVLTDILIKQIKK
ncbi:hypothetical protein DPMN_074516 [Dreissena polymorpha]|uniref:Uncharacterized protein n=1 Tax=Dreissena polymorpha TaxID=45954 RepID=A0A9D4BLN0_DREPO|nr:hypothetical protein DPMN_074516 [Dreissena polymorpha]